METSSAIWNEQLLREVVEDDTEMLHELIDLFFADVAARLRKVAEAVQGEEYDAVQIEAHTLKGASGNFGAERLHVASLELERSGANRDLSGCQRALGVVQDEVSKLMRVVSARRGGGE